MTSTIHLTNNMDLIIYFFGLSTMWIFMYKIQWLLETKPFIINLSYDLMLFVISVLLLNNEIANPKMVVVLKMPLLSSLIFFILNQIFKRIYKRNPKNTAWSFNNQPTQDVVFSLLFWFLGVGLPIYIFKI